MNPITFRPTEETKRLLDREQSVRPGVPMAYIINETISRCLGRPKQVKKSVRDEVTEK
jgi:hypothetical protein